MLTDSHLPCGQLGQLFLQTSNPSCTGRIVTCSSSVDGSGTQKGRDSLTAGLGLGPLHVSLSVMDSLVLQKDMFQGSDLTLMSASLFIFNAICFHLFLAML